MKFEKNGITYKAIIEENYINKVGIYKKIGNKYKFLKSFDIYHGMSEKNIIESARRRV